MKFPRRIIWKTYFLIFSTITIANLLSLIYSQTDVYIFYHVLMTWSNLYNVHYCLAILKCIVALICLIPLFGFAFHKQTKIATFWQWMLVARVSMEIFGNFYEFLFIKSSYHMVLGYGLATTGAFLLPLLPSLSAHYFYAFSKKTQ